MKTGKAQILNKIEITPFTWKYKIIFPLKILKSIQTIALVYILSLAIDSIFKYNKLDIFLQKLIYPFIAWGLAGFFLAILIQYLISQESLSQKNRLQKKIVNNYLDTHTNHNYTLDEFIQINTKDCNNIEKILTQVIPSIAEALITPLIILLTVTYLDPISALILICTGPLLPFFLYLIGQTITKVLSRQLIIVDKINKTFCEFIEGFETIKDLQQEEYTEQKMNSLTYRYYKLTLQIIKYTFLTAFTLELITTISIAIIAVSIGVRLLSGHINLLEGLFILTITPEYFKPIRNLALLFHTIQNGIQSIKKVNLILPNQNTTVHKDRICLQTDNHSFSNISLEKIHFSYNEKTFVIKNFTLSIQKGEKYLLTGPSGKGKTTLLKIIAGILTPQEGKIKIGLKDHASSETLKKICLYHPQNSHIISGTVWDNLSPFTEKKYSEVLKKIEKEPFFEFINNLENQMETFIGNQGIPLSSGQKQRIALLRTLLSPCPIILLDEPTAFLDIDNKKIFADLINQDLLEKSLLIVTHDQETINFIKKKDIEIKSVLL